MTETEAVIEIRRLAKEHGILVKMWTKNDLRVELNSVPSYYKNLTRAQRRKALENAAESDSFRSLAYTTDADLDNLSEAVYEGVQAVTR